MLAALGCWELAGSMDSWLSVSGDSWLDSVVGGGWLWTVECSWLSGEAGSVDGETLAALGCRGRLALNGGTLAGLGRRGRLALDSWMLSVVGGGWLCGWWDAGCTQLSGEAGSVDGGTLVCTWSSGEAGL